MIGALSASLLFFFFDLVMYGLFNQWLCSTLLVYFITKLLKQKQSTPGLLVFPFALLLIQDFVLYGQFGLALIYLIPLYVLAESVRSLFRKPLLLFSPLLLISAFMLEAFAIKWWVMGLSLTGSSFLLKLMVNLSIVFFYNLGVNTQGNRTLATSILSVRKVRTPNRKDALRD